MKEALTDLWLRSGRSAIMLLFSVLILTGCSDDDPGPSASTFVSSEFIDSNTASSLRVFLQLAGVGIDVQSWKYDVELYKIEYRTDLEGEMVNASALVILPDSEEKLDIISFHRGTITAQSEAPSEVRTTDAAANLYGGLASLGFAAVFPDMIGFGSTSDRIHPYYIKDVTANTVRDAIIATSEFIREQDMAVSGDLYLAGYSQGGYITMAAQQSIEQTPIKGLDLIASFPAAGAFDVKGLQEHFFTLETYEQPYYMAYVGLAYLEYFQLDLSLSDFFNDPFAGKIPDLFNKVLTGSQINEELSFEIDVLLNPEFLEGLETNEKYSGFNQLLTDNDLLNWTPAVPTFLYHGDADTFIPHQNTIDTYNNLLTSGAQESKLSLIIIEGEDHGGGVVPYAEDMAMKLLEFQNR